MQVTTPERPRPRFNRRTEPQAAAADPETLFGELARSARGIGALWSHQADQLRDYADKHINSEDVALELPTGSGKTLVGLLISEWRRRARRERVVYACPTKQLARQVFDKANRQGIPVVLLIGPNTSWPTPDVISYGRGEAIAVTTYSAIFNLNSHLDDAQVLVFDDAHAAEGYVGQAWALSVNQRTDAYHHVLDELADTLDPAFRARMVDASNGDHREVRLLPIASVADHIDGITRVLSTLTGDASYRFNMIRANLGSCLFYISRREIYIRPMIPPTFEHYAFTNPTQRLYLSATLGGAGELERAFGRASIERVGVPPAWEKSGSGRRFLVFPDLVTEFPELDAATSEPGTDTQQAGSGPEPTGEETTGQPKTPLQQLLTELLDLSKKRLILTPDEESALQLADLLGADATDRYTARDADAGIQPFLDADTGTLLAPNRYDGMDLAEDSCRLMIMAGLPKATHLQDQFLESKLGATEVLEERLRTRVLQGAGRCTRGPNDWAVVVIYGDELVRFLSRTEVRQAFPVELQAEIEFGFEQRKHPAQDLVYLAESALERDDIWREEAEPELADYRRTLTRAPRPNAGQLAASAPREVQAWTAAWRQDWEAAARAAVDVLEHLTASDLRPYRSLWAYLGSAWSALAAEQTDNPTPAIQRSAELLATAHRAAIRTTWLKEVQPQTGEQVDSDPLDEASVDQVIARLRQGPLRSATKFDRTTAEMLAGLNQKNASRFELGLKALGDLLGATESFKPAGNGRADAVWVWDNLWLTAEAKSEQLDGGMLSQDYVRQANTQLDSLVGDREVDAPPHGSFSLVVSPRGIVDPDAVPMAARHLHLVTPTLMLDIAHDVVRAWKQLRGVITSTPDVSGQALHKEAAQILWGHRVLPTQVFDRVTINPIRSTTVDPEPGADT